MAHGLLPKRERVSDWLVVVIVFLVVVLAIWQTYQLVQIRTHQVAHGLVFFPRHVDWAEFPGPV